MVHFSLDYLCYFLETFFFLCLNEIYKYLLYIAHFKVKKQEQNLEFRRLDKKTIILRIGKYFFHFLTISKYQYYFKILDLLLGTSKD